MKYADLSQMITQKSKEAGIKIESLPKLCQISRSTLYRYMKGVSPIPDNVEARFVEVLHLNQEEAAAFHQRITLGTVNKSMLDAYAALDTLLFGSTQVDTGTPIKAIFYHGDRYFRTLEEIFEMVLTKVNYPDAICKIRLINCMSADVLHRLSSFFTQLLTGTPASSQVEQLLTFVEGDHNGNMHAFLNIATLLPLSEYRYYTAYARRRKSPPDHSGLFYNSILIQTARAEKSNEGFHFFWFSVQENSISSCVCFEDPVQAEFVQENYNQLKKEYTTLLCDSKGINSLGKELLELSRGQSEITIKPNNCYDMVPFEQYLSLKNRLAEQEGTIEQLNASLADESGEDGIFTQLMYLKERNDDTYQKKTINLLSTSGIISLAKTGRLTDHIDALPSFSKGETRAILEYIRDRSRDPKDPYILYITDKPLLENGLIIVAFREAGVLVEYNQQQYQSGKVPSVFFSDPDLAEVIFDYMENSVPNNHALSPDEATKFLNEIIEKIDELI